MASLIEQTIRSTVGKGVNAIAGQTRKRLPEDRTFLEGPYAPMHEELTIENLPVTGAIPTELDGRYLRIGPNPVNEAGRGYHWFTGDGMAHGLKLEGGRARWYRNRWIRSIAVSEALNEPVAPGPRRWFDTVNTNVIGHGGRTWALVEAGANPVELTDTLETIAHNPFDGSLEGSYSAHPHRDPVTGELHSICYDGPVMDTVWHVVVDRHGQVRRREPIAVHHGPSIHDCAITAHHVVVLDLAVTFSMKAMLGGHRFPYRWNADHQCRLGLTPREGRGADTVWFDLPPVYVFHTGNAFEDEAGRVIVDLVTYLRMFMEANSGPEADTGRLERWIADPRSGTLERHVIDETPQDFPRYDERLTTRPYRYLYTMALGPERDDRFGLNDTRLFRHDLETGHRIEHDFGPGRHPGEFVFVPRGEDGAEDDGWLIGLVIDMPHGVTDLVILNADDFTGLPRAVVHIPHRVPAGFHGNWVAAAQA